MTRAFYQADVRIIEFAYVCRRRINSCLIIHNIDNYKPSKLVLRQVSEVVFSQSSYRVNSQSFAVKTWYS